MSSEDNATTRRTRASGEVLDFLLREFENNHNPSPEQRKEMSDKTNMTEKAIRIWFQNRRAKLRKFERMGKTNSMESSRSNSVNMGDSQFNSNNLYLSSMQTLPIDINEKYCFIDCTSLSVGSWQRIKSGYHDENNLKNKLINLSPYTIDSVMTNVDLLVILSKVNNEVNYFFSSISNNSKILFRIFYPLSSVVTCSLLDNNINKENNELRVSLSHQPKFSVYFFDGVNSDSNQWSICDDFSEGQQVSSAYCNEGGTSIPHVLVGYKNSLQYLNSFILEGNQIHPSDFHGHIQLSDPNDMNLEFHNDLNVWSDKQGESSPDAKPNMYSPLGQVDSDVSPNSVATSNSIQNFNNSLVAPSQPNHNRYEEVFNDNEEGFFAAGQTPNSAVNTSTSNENLINSPSTNIQSYTHHSPFANSHIEVEPTNSHNENSAFELDIHNGEFSNTPVENYPTPFSSHNHVDSFIDYGDSQL